ncbi:cation diffusion facilitator family transporter [Bacillus taeanensis]|uniref:Cation transporter n=1 Tax=Bacillus taeanensis TaxID=273032 RepID=A0A366XT54_9BACI|nr:cation diffusion facilitator family transporter [Bacillus taeanensis]RBW68335.1 cation transporter [Bacillus taeanensis]
MGHSHDHNHSHHANKKALLISFCLIATFMVVEVIGGFLTNSLALLSDAGHMLSDAVSLGLSLLAFKIGEKGASKEKTYGYKRFEILAAFINGVALLGISIYIFWEAYHRFFDPPQVSANMLIIACIGMVVNILAAWVLMKGDTSENLNLRSAFLHVLGDLLGSVGAIIAGLFILFLNWNATDPIASVLVAVLVLISGWRVTKDSFHVLMEGTPHNIDIDHIKEALLEIEGVIDVHDFHAWTITSGFPALSCHLIVQTHIDRDLVLHKASHLLKDHFTIKHTTIQIEGEESRLSEKEHVCE